MTQEQKEQLARQYADNTTPFGDHGGNNWRAAYNGYLAALDARDEEFALLRAEIEDDNAVMKQLKAELAKAQNPWVSVKEMLPEKLLKSDYSEVVLVRNKNGEVGKARYCHQGYMAPRWEHWLYGSGIPSPDYWMPIPQEPKGGKE